MLISQPLSRASPEDSMEMRSFEISAGAASHRKSGRIIGARVCASPCVSARAHSGDARSQQPAARERHVVLCIFIGRITLSARWPRARCERVSEKDARVRRICTRDARVLVISISGLHRKRAERALIGNFAPITDAPLKYRHGERDRTRSLARPPALDT